MAGVRFLDLVKPFAPYLPTVEGPRRKIPFNQKLMWTFVVLFVFLIMGEIPLYGIVSADSSDPLMWLRMMLASNRGTLMELGVTPLMTSGLILQVITSAGIFDVNTDDKRDRELLATAQKLLAIIMCVGQATVCVATGMYGVPSKLGVGVCALLVIQLVVAGLVIILLDELLQKGYGLGSGINLFMATNICESILWKCLSPTTINSGRGYEFEGAIVNLVHQVCVRRDKKNALVAAFTRTNLPNMWQVLVTVLAFFVVVFLQTLRVELPLRSISTKHAVGSFPIRLFYTSNTPIMLQAALTTNVFLASRFIFGKWPKSLLARFLGLWEGNPVTGQLFPVSGISYYLEAPDSWYNALSDPIRTVVYITYVLGMCALFSITWIDTAGTGPRDIARQLKDQGLTVVGHRDGSMYRELKRLIPTAAALGGLTIGLIAVFSEFVGTLSPGTSLLLATTTIYGYVETAVKEGGYKI